MNTETIMKIAQLNNELSNLRKGNTIIRNALTQLANDKCSTIIAFDIHNLDQHEKNKAGLPTDGMTFFNGFMGFASSQQAAKPCTLNTMISYPETASIRLISVMLREGEAEEKRVATEIWKLLANSNESMVTENPLFDLHK